jgi:hypothetical protein
MKVKPFFLALIVIFVLGSAVWAAGRKDNQSWTADDPSGFTDSIDTSGKKAGKYNFYMEGKDKAGNRSFAGPDNIWIDPDSDLPRTTVINPVRDMRIPGNLNIVGSAVDDDGIDHIEISITRGKDGKGQEVLRANAEGTEYWSYFLDTSDLSIWKDGVYTITAWAVDINGLSGLSAVKPKNVKRDQVIWHLDRYKPEIMVTSHEIGSLVAGKIKIKGKVTDGNGIGSFAYSTDDGNKFISAKTSYDKRRDEYYWNIDLNTKSFEDGAKVIWFQAKDGQGTLGKSAHLFFVNNNGPEVEIVYPQASETVNGVFSIAGYANHPVGLKSLSWKIGKESKEFDLITGNPFWSTDIDIRGVKTNQVEVEVKAVDVSNNATVKKIKLKVNQNADLPVVALQEPLASAFIENGIIKVKGTAADNDAVKSIYYSLDSQAAVEIPTSGYFQFLIENVGAGLHTLEVWAEDITGLKGPKVLVKGLSAPFAAPEIAISSFYSGSGKTLRTFQFYSGLLVNLPKQKEPKLMMDFTVRAENLVSTSVKFGSFVPVMVKPSGKDGLYKGSVQLPALQNGLVKAVLRATDKSGRETVLEDYFFANDKTSDAMITWNWPVDDYGRFLFTSLNEQLLGVVAGDLVSQPTLSGSDWEKLSIKEDKGRVIISLKEQGTFGPLNVSANIETSYGTQMSTSEPFYIVADVSAPELNILDAPEGQWLSQNADVKFNVKAASVRSVDYSLDLGASWRTLLLSEELGSVDSQTAAEFNKTVNLTDAQDGSLTVMLRVVDNMERNSSAYFTVLKDSTAPQAELIMPIAGFMVNGTIRLGFSIKEAGALKSVKYVRPVVKTEGEEEVITEMQREVYPNDEWNKDYPPMFLEIRMDSIDMPLDEKMFFIFEDMAGNTSRLDTWDFIIDREMDLPVVDVIMPFDNDVITTDFIISGILRDDDAVKQIYWRLDDEPEKTIEAENGFSIPVQFSTLTDNEHSVTIYAEDIYGVKGHPVTRNFRVSLAEPTAAITWPNYDTILRDIIEIKGTSYDANGIEKLEISIDNGNSFNAVWGAEEWSYSFNSKILKDGPHVIFLRVFDKYDIQSIYSNLINIDNTAPEILLDSPYDGVTTTGKLSVMGRAVDPNLNEVFINIRALEGQDVNENLKNKKLGSSAFVKEQLLFNGMKDGLYNLEIVADDKAGNVTRVSRNFEIALENMKNFVEVLYPLHNENVQGVFNLYGFTGGVDSAGSVTLNINGVDREDAVVQDSGYYRFSLNQDYVNDGFNTIIVYSSFGGGNRISSPERMISYRHDGPWVTIDNFEMGDFAFERPYLEGRSGYVLNEEDELILNDKKADGKLKAEIKNRALSYTELSFDNGRKWVKTSGAFAKNVDWRYRLETGDLAEGMHYLLIRSTMKNGETAVTRTLVQVDKTPPVIRLISPAAGEAYNTKIDFSASATDDVELLNLTYHLRQGDKSAYEIPGFIQGLYFEGVIPPFIRHASNEVPSIFAGGVTYTDFGMGLSFFDDNVKIQMQYGFMTKELYEALGGEGAVRYGGQVLGLKLLANIYSLPFGSFLGPDFEWLSASFAVGANFSLFDIGTEEQSPGITYTQSGSPTWMSALVMQIEFPKVTLPKRTFLRTFSLFTEGQLWFVPTDVDAAANNIEVIIPHMIIGLRLYIF